MSKTTIEVKASLIKGYCEKTLSQINLYRKQQEDLFWVNWLKRENSYRLYLNLIPFVNLKILTTEDIPNILNETESSLSIAEGFQLSIRKDAYSNLKHLCDEYLHAINTLELDTISVFIDEYYSLTNTFI